jgi:hypothetical protein
MSERTEGNKMTAEHQHARSWFDHPCSVWRCECGAPMLRDVREQSPYLEPSGTTGPAEAPKEETHMLHGSTVPGNSSGQSPVAATVRELLAQAYERGHFDWPTQDHPTRRS